MATKAKVLEISEASKITTANWDFFKFALKLDNDEKWWTTLFKTDKFPYSVWEEIEYDREQKWEYKSIKIVKKNAWWFWQKTPKDYHKDAVSFAMSYAKDLVIAGKSEDLFTQAESIYERMTKRY